MITLEQWFVQSLKKLSMLLKLKYRYLCWRLGCKIEAAYPDHSQGLHYPSMHQDYNRGRLTEIDYLNGQIVEYGKSLGIATPNNELITHIIHQLEMKLNKH